MRSAARGRNSIAMVVSPWSAVTKTAISTEGMTGVAVHSAPLGLRKGGRPVIMGSRPWLFPSVPLGLNRILMQAVLIVARLSQSLLCVVGEITKQLRHLFKTQKEEIPRPVAMRRTLQTGRWGTSAVGEPTQNQMATNFEGNHRERGGGEFPRHSATQSTLGRT
jgi:hypothetical protein